MPRFEYSSWMRAPVETVWAFHEREDALKLLSPPGTEIRYRKGKLETGARVELRAPLFGPVKARWLALHVDCEPGRYFVDEQIAGPFRRWVHRHGFEAEDGGTRLTDTVEFSLPLAPVSDWVGAWVVRLQLRAMFRRRHEVTRRECEGAG